MKKTAVGGVVVWAAPTVLSSRDFAQGTPSVSGPWVAVAGTGTSGWVSTNNGIDWAAANTGPDGTACGVAFERPPP